MAEGLIENDRLNLLGAPIPVINPALGSQQILIVSYWCGAFCCCNKAAVERVFSSSESSR